MAKIPSRFRSVDRHIQDFMQTIITAFNNQETKVGNAIGKSWDTAIHSIKEAWEKATGVVSAHSDITSAGAQIEDAVTKKHTQDTDIVLRGVGDIVNQEQTLYFNLGWNVCIDGGYEDKLAQTFIPDKTGDLSKIEVRGERIISGEGVIVEIRTVDANGVPTGTVLGSTTIPDASFENNLSFIKKSFETHVAVTQGTQYALVIRISSTGKYSFDSGEEGANRYDNGTFFYAQDEFGGAWEDQSSDLYFKIYLYEDVDLINNRVLGADLVVDEGVKIGTKTIEEYQSAVDLKHTEGKLKANSTDPTAGFLDEKVDDSLVLVSETHKIRVQKLDGGSW